MLDVTAFGAVGDGVTDDRGAIQSALDAGGWVYIPDGTYALTSGTLRAPARSRITLSPRATVLRKQVAGLITNEDPSLPGGYNGNSHVLIEGGTWDLNAANVPDYAWGIGLCHATDLTVRDTTIRDVPGWHAIEINSSRNALVDNCLFEGFYHTGDRNFSEAVQIDAAIDASTGFPPYDGAVCDDIEIRSCRTSASGTPGTQAWPRFVGTHSAPATWHRNIRVLHNLIDGATWCAIRTYWWDRAIIAHNQVVNSDGYGICVQVNSRYVELDTNQVFDSAKDGILVDGGSTQIQIRGNDVIGSGNSANNTYGGIHVGDASYARITGNTVRRRASGNDAKYGLWIESTASGIERYGNDLRYGGYTANLLDASPSPVTSASDAT